MSQSEAKVLQFKERFKEEAEDLVLKGFPSTILELNALIASPELQKFYFREMREASGPDNSAPPAKRARCDNNVPSGILVKSNKCLIDLFERVKPYMIKLEEDAKVMSMWISYMVPKLEDRNNFGVAIREETLSLVRAVERSATGFYDMISTYFRTRARSVRHMIKHPNIEDYTRNVQEFDENEYILCCFVLSDIRDQYCTMHDFVLKHLDTLKAPRPSQQVDS